jgi:hypothetical protein
MTCGGHDQTMHQMSRGRQAEKNGKARWALVLAFWRNRRRGHLSLRNERQEKLTGSPPPSKTEAGYEAPRGIALG